MDFLKAQFARIQKQLAGLTASQKMLAGSLVVIMVLTLVWWGRYASTSEMQAVLDQDFTPEEVAKVSSMMASRGIAYKVVGSRVQVPTDRHFEVLAMLAYDQVLPRDTANGFDAIIEKMDSPWNTDRKQDVVFNRAKEVMLAQVLRGFPGVKNATVSIDNVTRRAFGDQSRQPSAMVNLQTKDRDPGSRADKKIINAAADVVAGAVSGMSRSRVKVIIDGASYSVHDHEAGSPGLDTWMELVKEGERYFSQKIYESLSRYGPVVVSVTVDPKVTTSQIEKERYDKDGSFSKEIETTEITSESTSNSKPAGEPGAVPNASPTGGANQGLSLGAGGGSAEGTTSTTSENKAKLQVFPSRFRETIRSNGGEAAVVGASISLPRSHFVQIFKIGNPSAKDPDDAALQPYIDRELRSVKNLVKGSIGKTPEDKINVDWYYDYMPNGGPGSSAAPAVASSFGVTTLTAHTKEIALGVLAVVSLFMMMAMVRKGSPVPAPAPRKVEKIDPETVSVGEGIAGEVGEGTPSLDAVEVDDAALQSQQMIAQVQTMVKENPDAAANLVKRWLSK